MKRFIVALCMLAFVLNALCVPAYPKKVKICTESGDSVEILLKGDEFNKYGVTMDGYMLAPKGNDWYYLRSDPKYGFLVSDAKLNDTLLISQKKDLVRTGTSSRLPYRNRIETREKRLPSIGESHALVILIDYPDNRL